MARRKKPIRRIKVASTGRSQASSRKDIIIDGVLIMFVALLIGLAWQLYPDLSALVRRLIFVTALAVGGSAVVLRAKDIIK